jgi:predicted flap endonuclease-1-like 5' DNA nuclease
MANKVRVRTMRSDYLLYALAAVFFIMTAVSLILVAEQVQKSLWVVSTIVLGLFSVGLGYTQRPKTAKTESGQQAIQSPPHQAEATGDTHVKEAYLAENVERPMEPQVMPESPTPALGPVVAPMPVLTPAPVEAPAVPTSELTQVKGIGEKRAAQLKELGINNLDDLAKASAQEIAEKLNVFSPKIVEKWIAEAKELAK